MKPTPSPHPAVQTHNLQKNYSKTLALRGLNLRVPRGSVFGIFGPNGAGKSTTLGVLGGWLRSWEGDAQVLGVSCRRLWALRGRVGVMPQDTAFPARVLLEHQLTHYGCLMGMNRNTAQREAQEVLDVVGLSDARRLRGNELSHGMAKRANLAQALLGRPELLLLDEPLAGLDPAARRRIKDIVQDATQQATVVFASHDLSEAQDLCTHGAIIEKGKVRSQGSIQELTAQFAHFRVEFLPGAEAPLRMLREKLPTYTFAVQGEKAAPTLDVHLKENQSSPSNEAIASSIGEVLQILLAAGVPILGLKRGVSLERSVLNSTQQRE